MLSKNLVPVCRAVSPAAKAVFFNGAMHSLESFTSFLDASEAAAVEDTRSAADLEHVVYEVVRWRNARPCWGEQHAQRMLESLRKFDYVAASSLDTDDKRRELQEQWPQCFCAALRCVAEHNALSEQNIKVVVWHDDNVVANNPLRTAAAVSSCPPSSLVRLPTALQASRPFCFCAFPIPSFYPPAEWYERGCDLAVMAAERHDPHAKVASSEMAALRARAQQIQKEHGVFEVLLQRPGDGAITEGSRSNFLLVQKAPSDEDAAEEQREKKSELCVVQSLDEDVLLGITRETVNQICARHGIPMVKRRLFTRDLSDPATVAVALTGTSLGVLPVRSVATFDATDGAKSVKTLIEPSGAVHPFLAELQRLYVAYRDGEMEL